MKSRRFKVLAILLTCAMLLASCSKGKAEKSYGKHKMESEKYDKTEKTEETTEPAQRDTSVRPVATPTPTPEVIPNLTAQDIQNMNNGNALIVYNDEGYVSTIVGRFFHRPVTDEDDAINAVKGLQSLLGLDYGYFPFAVYGSSYMGCTYYTYQQIYGDVTVTNATLKVVLDAEGYPCMLQSSLVTNLGYSYSDPTITEADAEAIVLNLLNDSSYRVFSDYTSKTSLVDEMNAEHCFQVITNNPYGTISFDMPFIVHYISYDGDYLKSYPTGSLPTDQFADYGNDDYFKDLDVNYYSFTVPRNGQNLDITVPISFNPVDGRYYLADPVRKIIVADYGEFMFHDNLVFESVANMNEEWLYNHIITYYNYIQCYDFYKSFNIESTDGFGMPILILTGWCDEAGNPVNNACNMGVIHGWSCFGSSEANTYGYSVDICAHEFTHGVTCYSRQGSLYINETGAINEGYSDIMGNICEMYMGETTDTTWLMGETSNNVCRSMSNPYEYQQPLYVGDPYYLPSTMVFGDLNDRGGVHINNSLFSHLSYILYCNGMDLKSLADFYLCSIEMHTPKADFDDMYAILIASAMITDHADIIPIINQYWQDTKMVGERNVTTENMAVAGYQRLNLTFTSHDTALRSMLLVNGYYSGSLYYVTPQSDNVASIIVPADGDAYYIYVIEFTDTSFSQQAGVKFLAPDGVTWVAGIDNAGLFSMDGGHIDALPTYT
ncbi:MAG: M4 family metallopeptidase [Clostridiales bacterium]|nr:M4 family metallopeptidase [Clostridiales bacterium]